MYVFLLYFKSKTHLYSELLLSKKVLLQTVHKAQMTAFRSLMSNQIRVHTSTNE